jgi:hypothetical protein
MTDPVANFAFSTVATAPSPATSGTSVTLTDATNFPDPASVGQYNVTINAAGATRAQIASGAEIVRVTAKSSNTLTIVRATEGPNSARSVIVGDEVALTVTAKTVTDLGTVVIFDSILGSAAASIDTGAGAIPAGFKAIEVLYRVRTADAATVAVTFLRVNNDSSAIYDQGGLQFNGVGPAVFGNYAQTGWWTISVGATGTAHRFNAGSIVFQRRYALDQRILHLPFNERDLPVRDCWERCQRERRFAAHHSRQKVGVPR